MTITEFIKSQRASPQVYKMKEQKLSPLAYEQTRLSALSPTNYVNVNDSETCQPYPKRQVVNRTEIENSNKSVNLKSRNSTKLPEIKKSRQCSPDGESSMSVNRSYTINN